MINIPKDIVEAAYDVKNRDFTDPIAFGKAAGLCADFVLAIMLKNEFEKENLALNE